MMVPERYSPVVDDDLFMWRALFNDEGKARCLTRKPTRQCSEIASGTYCPPNV